MNLRTFVRQPFDNPQPGPDQNVDWRALSRAVVTAVRFLDNVVTYADPHFPLDAQRDAARRTRRIGLGVTALGDMLIALRLRYDSDDAIAFTTRLMRFIKTTAYGASADLAAEKGAFPAFDADQHLRQEFFRGFPQDLLTRIREHGLRNAAIMTVPPVGSGSALAGVTSGIEPVFALTYTRRSESLSRGSFSVVHPLVERYVAATGKAVPDLQKNAIPDERLQDLLPGFFVTAHQLDPLQRDRDAARDCRRGRQFRLVHHQPAPGCLY